MTSRSDTTIDRIETWLCSVILDKPVTLGQLVISHRDFVVVRMRTSGGAEGVAYSLTRGAPLDVVLADVVAPRLLGREALDTAARHEEMRRGVVTLGAVGLVGRAISLADICLWDLKGRASGMPVWRLLGGYRDQAPVGLVAPYAGPDEADETYADRVAELALRGYASIKLYPAADPAAMAHRLAAIRERAGDETGLVIDMAWSFRTAAEAIRSVRMWEPFDLAWVEDPFPSEEWRAMRALADAVSTPIAAGDEVSVPGTMERLITERAVDLVRLDATSIGGFTGFAALRQAAADAGYVVSTHAYGEIHRHCSYAWPNVTPIELFPPGSPTWGASHLLAAELDLPLGDDTLPAPTEPGLDLALDWDAVQAMAARHTVVQR
jgi:L-alanine-DL-glutamate epimerase-like enolase superfamily enzyme